MEAYDRRFEILLRDGWHRCRLFESTSDDLEWDEGESTADTVSTYLVDTFDNDDWVGLMEVSSDLRPVRGGEAELWVKYDMIDAVRDA